MHNQYLKVGGEDEIKINLLTLDILTSVNIFSIMFTIHFLRHCRGEFVEQSRASLVGDQFLYSCDLSVDSRVIHPGEISCQSLLGVKGLKQRKRERKKSHMLQSTVATGF